MSDTFSKEKRSDIMKQVRSSGNRSTELRLIHIFKERHIVGWRRKYPLYGRPDFVFPKLRIAIFADGCFWHGHNCRNVVPSTNADYWKKKVDRNRERDESVTQYLTGKGWTVLRIWECVIRRGAEDEINIIANAVAANRQATAKSSGEV